MAPEIRWKPGEDLTVAAPEGRIVRLSLEHIGKSVVDVFATAEKEAGTRLVGFFESWRECGHARPPNVDSTVLLPSFLLKSET